MQVIQDMIAANKDDFAIIDKALEIKTPVDIRYNNDTGKFQWAVEIQGSDFWIDAFKTKDDAIDFCKEKQLPVMNVFE